MTDSLAPAKSSQKVFSVPVTVSVTMTATVLVTADNEKDAVEAALDAGAAQFAAGKGFEIDDGNTRSGDDFYCPDEGDVKQVVDKIRACSADFERFSSVHSSNGGTYGSFTAVSENPALSVSLSLNPLNPDDSDEELRAQHTLLGEVFLRWDESGQAVREFSIPYEFYGAENERGAHLMTSFFSGDFDEQLFPVAPLATA